MGKKSREEQTRGRLLSLWEAEADWGLPLGCVATTFTFDAPFFEEQCLSRFAGLETDPNEDARAYLIEREEKFSQISACVLVDASHVAPLRSLRWNLLPVRLTGPGIMHAKVTLLVRERHIRLLIGSANLTEPGYRRNYEHVAVLDFGPDAELPLALLFEVIDFLARLRRLTPGPEGGGAEGPQSALERFLAKTRERAEAWESRNWQRGEPRAVFVPVFPGERTIFEWLADQFPGAAPNYACIVSPFFDDSSGAQQVMEGLLDAMRAQGQRQIEFIVGGRELHDDKRTVEIDIPDAFNRPAARCTHRFNLVNHRDSSGVFRFLHAKSLWLGRDDSVVYLIGSSNFTTAGTGLAGAFANVEANLAYLMNHSSPFRKLCTAAYPEHRELDAEEENIRFLPSERSETPDGGGVTALPAGFGLALYRPIGETGELVLSIGEPVPGGFQIFGEQRLLLNEESWRAVATEGTATCLWNDPRPPSHLLVRWPRADGACEAVWVVNVTDSSLLPPPDELRELDLDELLEILTSARPLHEAIAHLRRRKEREAARKKPDQAQVIDPHAKVDTRNFLLKRMKRVASALEGLRERLERPAFHIDALRWRLHGPVGPLALARRLVEQEPDAAAFMLAEVALTVRRADWKHVEAGMGRDACRAEVRQVVDQLREFAEALTPPPNLADYVGQALTEACK
ncbi:MAG: hypothetical protein U0587_11125 [Candidatus Binatia bacterium]